MVDPVPTDVPPQLPVYQYQEAPVPSDPPDTERSTLLPEQIEVDVADMEAGAVDRVFTVMVTDAQVVVLQVPSALT